MFQGFGHTAIWVKYMEKSLHFYLDILGCKKAFSMPLDCPGTGTEYIVASNGAFIELFYGGTPHETEKAPEGVHFTGFSHFCLVVDDMFKFVEEVEGRGGVFRVKPKRGRDGNWQAWMTDPDGIEIEFVQLEPGCKQRQIYFED